jgi:hypothetical protein
MLTARPYKEVRKEGVLAPKLPGFSDRPEAVLALQVATSSQFLCLLVSASKAPQCYKVDTEHVR